MNRIVVDGLNIAYRHEGSGPALVLLHGILSDSRFWDPQFPELSKDFSVYAWDAPGAGLSDDPAEDLGADGFAALLAGFMEALQLDRAHIAGLSLGGVFALDLFRLYPGRARSLILADTYAGWKGSLSPVAAQ